MWRGLHRAIIKSALGPASATLQSTVVRMRSYMDILLVTPMPPDMHGAGAIPVLLHAQLTELAARHNVTLVTVAAADPGEREALERLEIAGSHVVAVRRSKLSGLARWARRWRFASQWLGGQVPWRSVWFYEPELQRRLCDLLGADRFDLVLVEDNAMGMYRYPTTIPIIFTEYEVRRPRSINWHVLVRRDRVKQLLGELDWRRWRRYQPAVWRRFERIQVFSPRDAAAIRAVAPDLAHRVRINPFSVALPPLPDPGQEDALSLLFVGNFTHQPNVDAALWLGHDIMPRLRQRCSGVRLVLVGPYPPASVRALGSDDCVVTGRVPALEPYLARAAILLAPIRIGGGMRMKVLQGMAAGKAVVTTPRGAEGLAIDGHQPPVVLADNAAGLAEATAALLANPPARWAIGAKARAYATEHYSPAAYVRRLEATYDELVRARWGGV